MRFVIVGAGGVGGLLGGLLQHAGHEVGFVARGAHLRALQAEGLRVESPRATLHLPRVEAAEDPATLRPAEVVLVAVKSWQVPEVAPRLAPLLAGGGFAAPLENGVEAAGHLAQALGEERVVGGLCHMLAWLEGPGRVRHVGEMLRVTLGERRAPSSSARVEALAAALRGARVDAVVAADIEAAVWEKFLFIEPFGAVGAATRAPALAMRRLRESRELLVAAMEEVAALARSRGVKLPEGAVARALEVVDRLPPDATASMQRDMVAGRPSELREQTGAVVRLARQAALPAPVHAFLWAALLPQEEAARRAQG